MVIVAFFVAIALIKTTIAAPPRQDEKERRPSGLAKDVVQITNASLVEPFFSPPAVEAPGFFDAQLLSNSPNQWRMPELFKRQTLVHSKLLYRDISSTVTANGGTLTVTSTYSSVTIVTISSADVATVIATSTITRAGAKRGRNLRPADIPEQPLETPAPPSQEPKPRSQPHQGELIPHITHFRPLPHELKKRQTNFVSTITSVISTLTIPTTSTRIITTTIAAKGTATYSTTVWQTVTSVINARTTTTSTSTVTFTPSVTPNNVPITTSSSGSGGNSEAFWCRHRRKSRKAQNQEMISNAVTSAMAAQQAEKQNPQPQTFYDGKHLSTTTYSTGSPQPHSPSPPIHSPQPQYAYPAPMGHTGQQQPVYDTGPMALSDHGIAPHSAYSSGAPTYYGSEIDGNPVQRYELQQFSSPAPAHAVLHSEIPHPGAYTVPGGRGVL
ncbi:hypothetical protein GQ44DRAFT_763900 [Phaeosphaeriaceae sp. PMI808]|nr:hypothetical protein GQ44DRAFT_763900 [Phaeosphaeriaceae sp. PMI808]